MQVGPITGAIEAMEQILSLVEKARSFHSCKTLATDVAKEDTRKHRIVKLLDAVCRCCGKKGHFEKVCLKTKHSTHSLEVPEASNNSTGEPLYFNNDSRNKMENSTDSTGHSKLSTILLKADTGADVNLMNNVTFDSLFDRSVLQLTPIRMENYGNAGIKVLGKFHAFLRWKDRVYRQLFYITDCNKSPNLLSHDACYTLGVLKPCYTVEKALPVSRTSTDSTDPTKCQVTPSKVGNSFLHHKMKGTVKKLSDNSTKCCFKGATSR